MAGNVASFPVVRLTADEFKEIRLRYGFSHQQMSQCLNVSVPTIYSWENNHRKITKTRDDVENAITEFHFNGAPLDKRNMIFGMYSLESVRVIMNISRVNMAKKYGFSENVWQQYEDHRLILSTDIIGQIQQDMIDYLSRIPCFRNHVNN
jgi:DNA-binding XRE family transcriptional regulator